MFQLSFSIDKCVDILQKNPVLALGLRRDYNKTDVKKAYRAAALKYHPDKNADLDTSTLFTIIHSAYERLLSIAPKGNDTIKNNSSSGGSDSKPIVANSTTTAVPASTAAPGSTKAGAMAADKPAGWSKKPTTVPTAKTNSNVATDVPPPKKATSTAQCEASNMTTEELKEILKEFGFLRAESMTRSELMRKYLAVKAHVESSKPTAKSDSQNFTSAEEANVAKAWASQMRREMDKDRVRERERDKQFSRAKGHGWQETGDGTAAGTGERSNSAATRTRKQSEAGGDPIMRERSERADQQRRVRAQQLQQDLPAMSVSELRKLIQACGISDAGCVEKGELLGLLCEHFGIQKAQNATQMSSTESVGAKKEDGAGERDNDGAGATATDQNKRKASDPTTAAPKVANKMNISDLRYVVKKSGVASTPEAADPPGPGNTSGEAAEEFRKPRRPSFSSRPVMTKERLQALETKLHVKNRAPVSAARPEAGISKKNDASSSGEDVVSGLNAVERLPEHPAFGLGRVLLEDEDEDEGDLEESQAQPGVANEESESSEKAGKVEGVGTKGEAEAPESKAEHAVKGTREEKTCDGPSEQRFVLVDDPGEEDVSRLFAEEERIWQTGIHLPTAGFSMGLSQDDDSAGDEDYESDAEPLDWQPHCPVTSDGGRGLAGVDGACLETDCPLEVKVTVGVSLLSDSDEPDDETSPTTTSAVAPSPHGSSRADRLRQHARTFREEEAEERVLFELPFASVRQSKEDADAIQGEVEFWVSSARSK